MLTLIQNITILGMLYSVHAPFLKAVKLILFVCNNHYAVILLHIGALIGATGPMCDKEYTFRTFKPNYHVSGVHRHTVTPA